MQTFEEWIPGEMDRGLSQLEVDQMHAAWNAALATANERIRELERESEAHAQLQARCFDQGGNSVFDEVRVLRDELAAEREVSDKLVAALQVLVDNGGIGPESMFDDARAAITNVAAIRAKQGGN